MALDCTSKIGPSEGNKKKKKKKERKERNKNERDSRRRKIFFLEKEKLTLNSISAFARIVAMGMGLTERVVYT